MMKYYIVFRTADGLETKPTYAGKNRPPHITSRIAIYPPSIGSVHLRESFPSIIPVSSIRGNYECIETIYQSARKRILFYREIK